MDGVKGVLLNPSGKCGSYFEAYIYCGVWHSGAGFGDGVCPRNHALPCKFSSVIQSAPYGLLCLGYSILKPWAWHLGVSFAFGGFIVGYPLLNAMGFFLPPSVAQTAPICCNAKGLHSWLPLLNTMDFFLPPAVALTAPICCNAKGLHSWLPSVECYEFHLAISCSSALMSEPFFFK